MMDTQVLIIGGGPSGLMLANELGPRGIQCRQKPRHLGPGCGNQNLQGGIKQHRGAIRSIFDQHLFQTCKHARFHAPLLRKVTAQDQPSAAPCRPKNGKNSGKCRPRRLNEL